MPNISSLISLCFFSKFSRSVLRLVTFFKDSKFFFDNKSISFSNSKFILDRVVASSIRLLSSILLEFTLCFINKKIRTTAPNPQDIISRKARFKGDTFLRFMDLLLGN